jgi:hypothetical protein
VVDFFFGALEVIDRQHERCNVVDTHIQQLLEHLCGVELIVRLLQVVEPAYILPGTHPCLCRTRLMQSHHVDVPSDDFRPELSQGGQAEVQQHMYPEVGVPRTQALHRTFTSENKQVGGDV